MIFLQVVEVKGMAKTGRKSEFKLSRQRARHLEREREKARKAGDYTLDKRLRGILLVGWEGKTRPQAAEILEVEQRIIFRWQAAFTDGGVDALRTVVTPKPRRLNDEQLAELSRLVEAGPQAAGCETGIWTAPILAALIKSQFGVPYSASQVRRILHSLGFSLQFPRKKLARADLRAQAQWRRKTYPAIQKKAAAENGVIFF